MSQYISIFSSHTVGGTLLAATGNIYDWQEQMRTDPSTDSCSSHMRGVDGSRQAVRNGVGKKWLDSVCILKVEPTGFSGV